jgi:hypothetical protein
MIDGHGSTLSEAVLKTILYADVFDFPLTRDEVFRYLLFPRIEHSEVERTLDTLLACTTLDSIGQYVFPAGRGATVATRLEREVHARRAWRQARRYGRLIWMLPGVRMAAVTGALAMNNVKREDDIDFLVVAEPGRVWLTRAAVVLLVRLARLRGVTLCPNYILSAGALRLSTHDLYTAHELAQMVPLHGVATARQLLAENAWYQDVLPNSECSIPGEFVDALPAPAAALKRLGQVLLRRRVFNRVEAWERRRKIARLSRLAPAGAELSLSTEECKGHHSGHGAATLARWADRLAAHTSNQTA